MFTFDDAAWWFSSKQPRKLPSVCKDVQGWVDSFKVTSAARDKETVRKMVRRGIPDAVRGWAWARILGMDEVQWDELQKSYLTAFGDTFGPGLQPTEVVIADEGEKAQEVDRVLAVIVHRHPLLDSHELLFRALSILADYFEGEEMLWSAGERIIEFDALRRRSGDDFGTLPHRDMSIFVRLVTSLLRKEAPALAAHLSNVHCDVFRHLLLFLLRDIYTGTRIPCRLLECWLVEGFKVMVRFVLAHLLLKADELLAITNGPQIEHCLMQPAECPDGLVKLAFRIHFSRSMIKKKRYSLDMSAQLVSPVHFKRLPRLASKSHIIHSYSQWQALWHWLPPRYHSSIIESTFCTAEHGRSLQFLYLQCALKEPLVILVETPRNIVGAYLSKSFVCRLAGKTQSNHTYGTGETFVFQLRPEVYRESWMPDPDNHGFIVSSGEEGLGVGVGERGYALHIDRTLNYIRSSHSPVFNNRPLFEGTECIDKLEIWSFKV